MAAATTDKLTNTASTTSTRPSPTQVTSTRSAGVFTLQCNALTGWPTDTKVHFCTYKINTAGAKVAGSQIDMDGIVSGTSIGSITIRGGSDVGNAVGDIVEMAPTAAWGYDLNKWGTVHADASGNLLTSAVQSALGLSNLNGYTPVGFTPSTVTANGNRSYSLLFTGQDLTSFLSPGMRLRTTRTVAAPTQCTSLNGTTQYYSKTSPAGMTFTNNFVVSAWVKMTSYAAGAIVARTDGTSGWELKTNASGQLILAGYNAGAANSFQSLSYQSLPLNKWVHVAGQLDMTTTSVGTTNNYFMIDGVEVPNSVARAGTNPTSLLQGSGSLQIGATNSTLPFSGKIAQVAIYGAKVTEATIQSYMNQGLLGTETSIISAYSLSNSLNDLVTGTANNLTANGSATTTNADAPFGGQAGGTISSTLDYAIVQTVTFSTNTTVVVQVPEGCTIPTSGGVSSVVYSSNDSPYGFPKDEAKWEIYAKYKTATNASNTTTAQHAGRQIQAPIGAWTLEYFVEATIVGGSSGQNGLFGVSTSTSTFTEDDMVVNIYAMVASQIIKNTTTLRKPINVAAATPYYVVDNVSNAAATVNTGSEPDILTLRNNYL